MKQAPMKKPGYPGLVIMHALIAKIDLLQTLIESLHHRIPLGG
jgi:hypothetical protein